MALSRFNPALTSTAAGTARNILYVEDEDTNWEITEFALRDRYRLTRAQNSRDAFALLSRYSYDLILIDIQLSRSELNGIEIARILKGRYDHEPPDYARDMEPIETPIIFVTAYTARYRKEELLVAGGDELVLKPVDFTRLSMAMARLMIRDSEI